MSKCCKQTTPPNQFGGFTPEEMAASVHNCSGETIVADEGVTTGYTFKGNVIGDFTSAQCVAKQITYNDPSRNEYYIGATKTNGLFDPSGAADDKRYGWISCNKRQFDVYMDACRNGLRIGLGNLKDELRVH